MADPLEAIPVLPDGVEGVIRLRMPAGYEPPREACVDCGELPARHTNVLADADGLHCAVCLLRLGR